MTTWRFSLLTAALLAGAERPLAGQSDSSPFRRLELAPPTIHRSAGGGPGPAYWQNRADYTLAAVLDTATHELRGSGTIRYTNHSPDTLAFVWLQLDQNIQSAGSINRLAPPPPLLFAGVPFDMAVAGPAGGYTVDSLRVDRGLARAYLWDTMLRLDLERALGPGESLVITLGWRFTVPVNGVARMGRDGALYEIAQWYPRLAVYDDVNGWNTLPYIGPGEFYLEYGDFDVSLTVPASYIVAATGVLANATDVLTGEQIARMERAARGSDVVAVITGQEAGDVARTRPRRAGAFTWRFTAENVRDFAFAAAPNFRWDMARFGGGPEPRVVHTFYRPGAVHWEEAARLARHAMAYFSERWLDYPYPQATVVEGPIQGMEYPMIVFVPADPSRTALGWVLIHELGHQWFPMIVGNDERRYPWMDEGFNSFIDLYAVADYFRADLPSHADSVLNGPLTSYAENAVARREQALITPPAEVYSVYWTAYQKPALMLRLLREEVLGADAFDAAFREFTRRWAFRHPQPADFFRTMENVSGRDLDWFWRQWIYTTARLDQAVDSVRAFGRPSAGGDSVRVVLGNRAGMVMPVEVRLTWSDGQEETRRIPVEAWNYGRRHAFTLAASGRRLVRVEVDPRRAYPDVERRNNTWRAAGR
jgi:hypothetical protein